ncbi:TonB-dependent receptor [Uliginosibacterium sp. H1]|uniref:TonB-dependent receptor n=1 Tax=Uliginosibacterium sp. H1 TaxID=3114757 RepID=UPI002E196834|nr:TonB-dependent receptor [Uliginosibacterium sp. H1]
MSTGLPDFLSRATYPVKTSENISLHEVSMETNIDSPRSGAAAMASSRVGNNETGNDNVRAPRQAFALSAMTAAVWMALGAGSLAMAQPARAQAPGAVVQPQAAAQRFSVPAGPLAPALRSLASSANLLLTFTADQTEGRTTRGIEGSYTPEQALAALLEGSGLQAVRLDNGGYVLRAGSAAAAAGAALVAPQGTEATLPVVQVRASAELSGELPKPYAGGQVARGGQVGMLGNKDVMDTPFSQTNYTNQTIRDQQAQTVQDVLSNDPSILTKQNNASDEDGSITVRGFSNTLASGFGSLNGVVGMSPLRSPDMDYIERVEVLRGPSALLNGMAASGAGGIGGSYNLVTKQARDEPLTELTLGYASRSQLGGHLDVGRRFGAENQVGIRFNGAYRNGETSVDPTSAEVGSAALNMDYRDERVRISADLVRQSNDSSPQNVQQLVVSGVGGGYVFVPEAPDAGTNLNPEWSSQPSTLTLGMLRGEVDISDKVTAYAAVGKQKLDFSLIGPSQPTLRAADGTFGWNYLEHTNFAYEVLSVQGGLRAEAVTGPVAHALSLNLSQSETEIRESATQVRPYNYTTNLYNPVFGPAPYIADPGDPRKTGETRVSSIGFADTLSTLDKRFQLTLGVRRQEVETGSFNTTTGAKTAGYESDAWTPAVALVVKPWQANVSLYANYIEALQAGTIVGTQYANAGEVFSPYVSKQYEAGAKIDAGTVTTTVAVFQVAQPNTISVTNPAGGLPTLALNGELRNRGIELNAYGEPTRGVRMMGGVTLLDGIQTKTQGGLYDGNREAGVPAVRTVIGGEWDTPFLQSLTLTGRFTYTGDQVVSSSNENLKIPSWTVFDLGARYVLSSPWNNKPTTIRFNVDNVFDKDYWASANFRYVQLGAPRIYRLSATFAF